ncbi:hypothetical protein FSP39_019584 [Pinctada imbricata]|uniref:Uncharacterized protein n=1 Tax=Pinctada imbricata TaxID=66713 RepID=A0AA89C2F1_PINIB|nr:hypothetical protein FSP39_019584 [Pinctada imbricata]
MDEDPGIANHSESIYQVLCNIVGDEDNVKLNRIDSVLFARSLNESNLDLSRRQRMISRGNPVLMTQLSTSLGLDKTVVELIFQNLAEKFFANLFVDSGSRAEGFDFQSSDFDIMCVLKDVNVIQRAIQENMSESSMILSMETGNTRPGFVRLKALYYPLQCSGIIGLRKLGQEYYMSSNKLVEWRMSFSLAEKRLVRFMNHTQFLTYGLLKLFLKEVMLRRMMKPEDFFARIS